VHMAKMGSKQLNIDKFCSHTVNIRVWKVFFR
jgi:hypothetical protein